MDEAGTTQVLHETPDVQSVDAKTPGSPPRMRWWIAAAAVVAVVAAITGGVYLAGRGDDRVEADQVAEREAGAEVVETIAVPDLRGMTLERATQDVEAAGLVIGSVATAVVEESVAPAGTVFSQDPLPGAEVAPGAAVAIVVAEAPPVMPPAEPPSTGGSSGGSTPSEPPPAPDDLEVGDMTLLPVKPIALDPGVFLLQPQWTTVLEHVDTALEWTSGPVTLGAGEKRIILNGDGPNGFLVGVHSWGPGQTDWKLRSLVVSQPGENPYESVLDVPAGAHTFRVKSLDTSVLWTITVQEKK